MLVFKTAELCNFGEWKLCCNKQISCDMYSVFDEIIFLADYIEEGRAFIMCQQVREEFFALAAEAHSYEDDLQARHRATFSSLQNTIKFFVSRVGSIVRFARP